MAGYAISAAAVGAVYLLRLAVMPVMGAHALFLLFVLPVVFAVRLAGRGPAILAFLLSLAAGFALAPEVERFSGAVLFEAGIFALVCGGIGWCDARLAGQRRLADNARRQLELLIEGAQDYAILLIDPSGNIATWPSGAERLLGWKAEEAIGRHFSIFSADPDAHAIATAELESAMETGRFSREKWQCRADRSEFLADVSITPIFDEEGTHRGFAKVIHDVTALRANERALERREKHLQSILATIPDAMVVIDDKGAIISFSSAAERLFGHREEDVVGRNVSMLMPSPDRERHESYIRRYLESGTPRIIGIGRIVSGLRADGSTFPMKLSVGEVHTEEVRLFTGFVQNLTERRDFEEKLEQIKSELIHVSRLSAMGTIASTLAHELNQPLTAIASYGEAAAALLESDSETDRAALREAVEDMAAQALRAGRIVRRLRQFVSRGEFAKTIEDLPSVIDEASALALVGTREQGIATRFNYAPGATPVLIDRVQIQQVLLNLMRNAVEAMADSPVRELTVSTAIESDSMVRVSVRDTGPGIDPKVRGSLFEAFNSSKSEGMGLGLSICRTIIEAHGGQIRALDCAGGGTEFQFTLMRAVPAPDEAEE